MHALYSGKAFPGEGKVRKKGNGLRIQGGIFEIDGKETCSHNGCI